MSVNFSIASAGTFLTNMLKTKENSSAKNGLGWTGIGPANFGLHCGHFKSLGH